MAEPSPATFDLSAYGMEVEPSVEDLVQIEWLSATPISCRHLVFLGDRYATFIGANFGDHAANVVGKVKLVFGDNRYRRKSLPVGIISRSPSSDIVFVELQQTSFERSNFLFIEEIAKHVVVSEEVLYLQAKAFNSVFVGARCPPGLMRISTSTKLFEGIPKVPEGYFVMNTAAAVINKAQEMGFNCTALFYDVVRDDLTSLAKELSTIVQRLGPGIPESVFEFPKDIVKAWIRRVQVDDNSHLYM